MKHIVIFCALCALFGCRQANVPQTEPIALYYSIAEQSKTDLLTQGDEIGVFSNIEGTEQYFLENVPFVVGADGRSLSTAPAVYYPEAKQAINFYAYLPFGGTWDGGVGTFSVPSDQTTTTALKQADLCWATASSTPVAAPVALEFSHKMARLLITTNEPTTKIAIPNAFSGGTLDIKTGTFTNTLKSEVFTTGTELILPAQSVTRLLLTVAGVEHPFTPAVPLDLPAGQTTTLNLTLNPITKTATLAGSSTTDWTSSAIQGNPTQTVSNILTMHWPNYVPQGTTPNKITLTINGTDYTVNSGITYANKTFTVPFASAALRYPYTISKITFYNGSTQALPSCTQLLGATIYKSAAQTVGIKDPANAIKIGNLWWTTGNLVANGPNGCRIGAPTDCGIYFGFGSLVGLAGGATGDGTGTGVPGLAIKVTPKGYTGSMSVFPILYYTEGSAGTGYCLPLTDNANQGIGDPCRYYLGPTWRIPTTKEQHTLCNNVTVGSSFATAGWVLESSTPWPRYRHISSGLQYLYSGQIAQFAGGNSWAGKVGYYWSSSIYDTYSCYDWSFGTSTGVRPQLVNNKDYAKIARCVSSYS